MIFTLFTCSMALPIVPDKAHLHILRRFVLSCENKLVKNPPQMSKKKTKCRKNISGGQTVKRTTNRSNVPPGGPPQSNDVVLCTRTTGIPSVSQYHSPGGSDPRDFSVPFLQKKSRVSQHYPITQKNGFNSAARPNFPRPRSLPG